MTTAPAAAHSSHGRAALALPGWIGLLAPAVGALILTCLVALVSHHLGDLVAAALAVLLLGVGVLVVRATRTVTGRRAVPRWYAPAALAVTVVVLVVRELISGWSTGFDAADAVLLAAAPGALLVAAEAPLWRALRRGRVDGVSVRSTAALPLAVSTRVLALDGVSTLVDGKIVDHIEPVEESHLRNLRWFAGALAHSSGAPWGHPIGRLSGRGREQGKVTGVVDEHDGVSGSVDRHPVRLGTLSWLGWPAWPVEVDPETPWDVLGVEVDGRPLGAVTVADKLRDDTDASVGACTSMGVRTVLIDDASPPAAAIAELAGIELVGPEAFDGQDYALVCPGGRRFASAGLVLGPDGEQLSVEQADLGSGARALHLCRDADHSIHRGVILALGWHAACVVLAAAGVLAPWSAAALALIGAAAVFLYPAGREAR